MRRKNNKNGSKNQRRQRLFYSSVLILVSGIIGEPFFDGGGHLEMVQAQTAQAQTPPTQWNSRPQWNNKGYRPDYFQTQNSFSGQNSSESGLNAGFGATRSLDPKTGKPRTSGSARRQTPTLSAPVSGAPTSAVPTPAVPTVNETNETNKNSDVNSFDWTGSTGSYRLSPAKPSEKIESPAELLSESSLSDLSEPSLPIPDSLKTVVDSGTKENQSEENSDAQPNTAQNAEFGFQTVVSDTPKWSPAKIEGKVPDKSEFFDPKLSSEEFSDVYQSVLETENDSQNNSQVPSQSKEQTVLQANSQTESELSAHSVSETESEKQPAQKESATPINSVNSTESLNSVEPTDSAGQSSKTDLSKTDLVDSQAAELVSVPSEDSSSESVLTENLSTENLSETAQTEDLDININEKDASKIDVKTSGQKAADVSNSGISNQKDKHWETDVSRKTIEHSMQDWKEVSRDVSSIRGENSTKYPTLQNAASSNTASTNAASPNGATLSIFGENLTESGAEKNENISVSSAAVSSADKQANAQKTILVKESSVELPEGNYATISANVPGLLKELRVEQIDALGKPVLDKDGKPIKVLLKRNMQVKAGQILGFLKDDSAQAAKTIAERKLVVAEMERDKQIEVEYAQQEKKVAAARYLRAEEANKREPNSVTAMEITEYLHEYYRADKAIEKAVYDLKVKAEQVEVEKATLEEANVQIIDRKLISPLD